MSIKKFFDGSDKSRQYLTDQEQKEAFKEIESSKNLKQLRIRQDTHLPQVDYADPDNFAKFGSAYLYYKSAVERILDYYPYDGSDAELNEFYNRSLPIEKHIFNKMYPRTNGYITFCTGGWGTRSGPMTTNGYGLPETVEYITFYGGPNISTSLTKLKDMEPDPLSSKFQSNNIYDESIYDTAGLRSDYGKGTRESNLKSDFDTGVTVEFWLKTGSLGTTETHKQVVFDMWNNEVTTSAGYGRITIELTGGAGSGNPILVTAQSGTVSASAQMCFTSSIGQDLSSGDFSSWRHYAITMYNSGSDFKTDLYVNGYLNDTNAYTGGKLGELNSKNMVARIGALVTSPSGSAAAAGAGKLSGSLDEFRFWKVRRNGAQIGKYWFDQIRGGVNTDISNTELGMYYKFNEGITGDSDIDSVVLDYGGRLCNGVWTGYTTTSRNTGSAILSSSAATKEYEDPIIQATHPRVSELKEGLMASGSFHDSRNSAIVRNLVPSWITKDMEISDQSDLDKMCHILGTYFDKLYLQIGGIPTFKHLNYTSASAEALPFAQHLPQSLGLYTPEIFVDSTILEKFKNRTDKEHFQNDLVETKNLIYSNLYNNLAGIYKAKGTEKAIRNTLRCFNLNDNLVTYNVYSNNQQYELKNSLKQTLKRKTFANFNTSDGITAVIHQAADPHTGSTRGYISGTNASGYEDKYGFTAEASLVFPRFYKQLDPFPRDFSDISLFGVQTVNTASTSDTAFLTGAQDVANFQVYAVRDESYSKNAYFVLTSSTDPHNFPTLTSSMFFDVYDDSNWNFSVRIKPSNYGFTDLVSGSQVYNYDVVFRGINNNLGTVLNEFEVSSSVTKAVGQSIVRAPKRLYVGARNTNITGANVYKSDILAASAKYWTKYIDNLTLNQHLFDSENFGISGSYEHISALDSNLQNTHNYETLALNWYFGNVTSSDASGNFYVTDLSSGSAENRSSVGWIGNVGGHLHSGKGSGFYTNDSNVIRTKNVNEFKFIDPERAIGSDMVQIRSADDEIFGSVEQIPNYIYTIEKSLYGAVTEEILDFFAGAIDFHHLIGHPANRYRMQYKAMEHLRRVYFERVKDVGTVEKFTEYYKWFDDALAIIIGQLVPASADFVKDSYNTVESHVLERNKYKTQFPTIEFRSPDPEPPMRGVGEAAWPWDASRSPLPSSPRSAKVRPEYWQKRAETSSPEITSGDSTIDAQRQTFKEVIWSTPNLSKSMPTLSSVGGVKYHHNQNLRSQQNQTYFFDATFNRNIKGGTNFDSGKNIAFTYNSLAPAGPVNAPSGGVYVPLNVLFADIQDLVKIQRLELSTSFWRRRGKPNEKVKRIIKVQAGRAFEEGGGYTSTKSTFSFPFNIMSSSVISGFNSAVIDRVTASIEITNLHNDVYGEDMERPMQTTWSEYAAGGHQSRHVGLNIYDANKSDEYNGLDNYTTRPEAWKILLGNCSTTGPDSGTAYESGSIGMVAPDYPWPEANEPGIAPYPMTASQKAVYYRDFTAKTPYVFKNIRMRTGSTILGNYRNNYEIVQTVGAWNNPRQFAEINGQPDLPARAFANSSSHTTNIRTFLDIRRGRALSGSSPAILSASRENIDPALDLSGTTAGFQFVDEYSLSYLTGTENKSVFKSRFSNPGGLEVNYRDFRSDEFSVYNATRYRNMTILKPSQGPRGTISEVTGVGGPGIRVFDIHGMDYGLRSHLSRHTARFGRDSLIYTPDGLRDTYSLTKPFIGYGDSKIYRGADHLRAWWSLKTSASNAGYVENRAATASIAYYPSLTASWTETDLTSIKHYQPVWTDNHGPSHYIQTSSFNFVSGPCDNTATGGSICIGSSTDWDPIIGNGAGASGKFTLGARVYYNSGALALEHVDGAMSSPEKYPRALDFGNDVILYVDRSTWRYVFAAKFDSAFVHWGTDTGSATPNTWQNVMVTFENYQTTNPPIIYIDGASASFSHYNGTFAGSYYGIATNADCFIGNNYTANRSWSGSISDVAVWDSVLSSDEAAAWHNASRGPRETSNTQFWGPGSPGSLKYPGYHKVHRNSLPRLKLGPEGVRSTVNYNTGAVNDHTLLWQDPNTPSGNDMKLYHSGTITKAGDATNSQSWTLVMWFNKLKDNSNDRALISLGMETGTSNKTALMWRINGGNPHQELTMYNASNNGRWVGSTQLQDDNWYHIAVTFNGSSTDNDPIFYVDGVADTTTEENTPGGAMTLINSLNGGRSAIGAGNAGTTDARPWQNIGIAEVAMYDTILSAAEIAQIYNEASLINLTSSAIAPKVDNLVTWLRMGDAKGVEGNAGLYDLSGSNTAMSSGYTTTSLYGEAHTVYDVRGNNHFAFWNGVETNSNPGSWFSASLATVTTGHPAHFTGTYAPIRPRQLYESSSYYDNFYVQHPIPRSDKQYAWITGAIHDPLNDHRFTGYMPIAGTDAGMFSSSYTNGPQAFFNFVSASDMGSAIVAGARTFGYIQREGKAGYLPNAFNYLNIDVYEPLSASTNTLGRSDVPLVAVGASDAQFSNTTLVPFVRGGVGYASARLFNPLMLKRNGIYGYGTFAQARQADHPVAYDQRKNNKLMVEYKTPGTPQEFALRPVSMKGRPVILNLDYKTEQTLRNQVITKTTNATLKTSYNNEFIYFNSQSLDSHFDIDQAIKSQITPFEQLVSLKDNNKVALNWIHYKECVFPSLKNEFSPTTSFRYGYDNKYWRDDPKERIKLQSDGADAMDVLGVITVPQSKQGNSMGVKAYLSESSWPLDAPGDFLTRTSASCIYAEGLSYLYYSTRQGGPAWLENYGRGPLEPWEAGAVDTPIAGELQNTYGWLHQSSSRYGATNAAPDDGTFNWGDGRSLYYDFWTRSGLAAGALYGRKQTLASPLSINPQNYQNVSCSVWMLGDFGGMNPQQKYASSSISASQHWGHRTASLGAGEAFWDAPRTAGYLSASRDANGTRTMHFVSAASKPFYNDYDKFKENDLKFLGRGYSVVPEYRISERLDDYEDGAIDDQREFTIPGTEFDSADENFYIDFSNSDFMNKFLDIRKMSDLEAKEIKLTCNAVVKFNPYKGFYPAQRALDLVSQFSKSYGGSINIEIPDSSLIAPMRGTMTEPMSGLYRLALQPLFAPGILFNSIKAGIACDWPMVTERERLYKENYTGSRKGQNFDYRYDVGQNWAWYPRMRDLGIFSTTKNYVTGQFWDTRVPFEAIINPGKALNGVTLVDMEPHPLVAFVDGHSASVGGHPSDSLYTRMASNFVAEVGEFFLKGKNYSRLESKGVSLGKMTFPAGQTYMARLRMKTSYSGSRSYKYESGSKGDNTFFTEFGCGGLYNNSSTETARKNGNTTGSFEIPQDPGKNPEFKRDFVMYSRTTAFGPPFSTRIPRALAQTQYATWRVIGDALSMAEGEGTDSQIYPAGTWLENSASWVENVNMWNASASASGAMDCMNGYNWGYTPPYYHGEAWCDFIFRPNPDEEYSLEKIVANLSTSYWRCDPGPQTGSTAVEWGFHYSGMNYSALVRDNPPLSGTAGGAPLCLNNSPYSSININANAMQLSHSINLFGVENVYKKQFDKFGREILTEREVVGKKWVIQPKFETPMLNFADTGPHPIVGETTGSALRTKTVVRQDLNKFGYAEAPNGMWHQFGILPDKPNKGIFLDIGDVPASWLQYHYTCVSESSVYNNYSPESHGGLGESTLSETVQSLTELLGFTEDNSQVRLGRLGRRRVIKEAVVAIPYILKTQTSTPAWTMSATPVIATTDSTVVKSKQFISIPKNRVSAAMAGEEGSASGDSLDTAGQSIRRLITKMRDYVLPPKFDFLNNPDSVDPIVMYMFEFKYELDRDDLSYIWQNIAPRNHERSSMQKDAVSHELFNTELLTEQNIMDNPNLRWMVFKVKQRSQKLYKDKVVPKFGALTVDKVGMGVETGPGSPMLYNWPYDYLSIVELVKLEAEVLYRDDEIELDEMLLADGLLTAADIDPPTVSAVAPSAYVMGPGASPTIDISESDKVIKKAAKKGDVSAKVKLAVKKKSSKMRIKAKKKKTTSLKGGRKK